MAREWLFERYTVIRLGKMLFDVTYITSWTFALKRHRSVEAMRSDVNSTQIQVLDGTALSALSTELNSSKYVIDAHNRSIRELGNLSDLPKLCSLDVSFNKITSLRNVSTARELRELKINNNKLTNTIGLKA